MTSSQRVDPQQSGLAELPSTPERQRAGAIAAAIAERVAELLDAPVTLIDLAGQISASSAQPLLGEHGELYPEAGEQRVPLRFETWSGEVLIGPSRSGEVVGPRLAQALVELVVAQVTSFERAPQQNTRKNSFIHDLLHGLIDDEIAILAEARSLGLDFGPPRAVLLIDAAAYIHASSGDSPETRRRRAQIVISSVVSFFQLPNDTICASIGNGEVAVLKASNTSNLASWAGRTEGTEPVSASWANLSALRRAGEGLLARLRADLRVPVSIGIGRHHPGITGLARSYKDARAALSLGRSVHGHGGVHCLDQLGIAAFIGISDERTKFDLATYLLSPLDHAPDLVDTIRVFFETNCSPSDAARRLDLHRNTLSYRLDKIASLTGLDPRHFDDAVQIRLALALRSLQHAE